MIRNTLHVLVVDGNEAERTRICGLVEPAAAHIQVMEAHTFDEARDAISCSMFDCAVLNQNLPEAAELDLLPFLEEIPTLMLLPDTSVANEVRIKGVQVCVNKNTLNTETFLSAIHSAIDRKHAEIIKVRLQHEGRFASLGRLAASMAHEINNPNTVIASNLGLMQHAFTDWGTFLTELHTIASHTPNGPLEQLLARHQDLLSLHDISEMLDESLNSINRVTNIIRQLRMMSHSEAHEAKSPINLNHLVSQACLLSENRVPTGTNVIQTLLEPLPHISGKRNRLSQMIVHLLLNSAQAISESPAADDHTITITTTHDNTHILLSIQDTGAGIDPEHIDQVFTPFFTTRPFGEGLGLGLTLAEEIVREHNGTITIHPNPERGAHVLVNLPISNIGPSFSILKARH